MYLFIHKNVISYLLLVQSGSFHLQQTILLCILKHRRREEVRGTTTAGDWVWGSVGDVHAFFVLDGTNRSGRAIVYVEVG
jgi:hypothetical protein